MLMRKTSAPAANSCAMMARSDEAGPSVATILVRRWRLIGPASWAGAMRRLADSGVTGRGLPGGSGRCAGCSLDSVSCTVQERCSPVSTSKKPVRSKPRARQSSMPRMVNSLSRVHMKACPDHSPPRS